MDRKVAIDIAKKAIPNGIIHKIIEYDGLYILIIFTSDKYEGDMDAIYSVSKATGEFRDFNYVKESHLKEVTSLFENAPIYKEPSFKEKIKTSIAMIKAVNKSNVP